MVGDARLTSEFWVKAYLARLRLYDIPVFVRARGDATAGAILIKLSTLDGQAQLFTRGLAFDGPRGWDVLAEGEDADVEAAMARQRSYDSDVWVLELEDAQGRHLLNEPGLRD